MYYALCNAAIVTAPVDHICARLFAIDSRLLLTQHKGCAGAKERGQGQRRGGSAWGGVGWGVEHSRHSS